MSSYAVSVRGPVPPDLRQKLSEAHARAVRDANQKPTGALSAPAGSEVADVTGKLPGK